MLDVRRDSEIHDERGSWFRARWHFSFDHYRDPENMGIGPLRVFNDDRLVPGAIWPMHPHQDVEGLTYVVEGLFRHQDDVGGDPGPLPAGSVQRMTLGRGAHHSEQNASETEAMRFIQIWILPHTGGLEPGVEQKVFTQENRRNRLLEVFNADGSNGAVTVHGDARVAVSRLDPDVAVKKAFDPERAGYLYVIEGAVRIDGTKLETGDAVKVWDESDVEIAAEETTELILVDVPTQYHPVGVWAGR